MTFDVSPLPAPVPPVNPYSGQAVYSLTTGGGALPMLPGVPNFTSAQMPNMTGTAQGAADAPVQPPAITPEYLNQRLPSIIDTTPLTMAPQCDPVSQWVMDNPVLAMGLLVGAYALLTRKG